MHHNGKIQTVGGGKNNKFNKNKHKNLLNMTASPFLENYKKTLPNKTSNKMTISMP
jgi:hypothetical protein